MRFLVDGYNVTKRDPATCALELSAQRDALVARLVTRGRDLLGAGGIVVVFDGVSGGGADGRRGPVEIRYARGGQADDLIASLAESDTTVVTSDRGLAERVRSRGAAVRDAEVVFESVRTRRRRNRRVSSNVGLPPGANRVTEELKKLWLGSEE